MAQNLAPITEIDTVNPRDLKVVANSGIQFLDFKCLINLDNEDDLIVQKFGEGRFFMSATKDKAINRLVPRDGDTVLFYDSFDNSNKNDYDFKLSLQESLELYDEVWFPIPYIVQDAQITNGPINWARARVVLIKDDENEEKVDFKKLSSQERREYKLRQKAKTKHYHITIAFDTKIDKDNIDHDYLAPTATDLENGNIFSLEWMSNKANFFLEAQGNGKPWVNEWAASILISLGEERVEGYEGKGKEFLESVVANKRLHEAHYLNMLAFLGGIVHLPSIKLIDNYGSLESDRVGVNLILDIGNARSCGLMVEDRQTQTSDFPPIYTLKIRDLNNPQYIYEEPFTSRVEFQIANFDFDNKSARSGRPDAFTWHSLVRLGNEATKLSSRRSGSENDSGTISPKRYLWDTQSKPSSTWDYNQNYYQINSKNELAKQDNRQGSVQDYINSQGEALFAITKGDNSLGASRRYSMKSTMTFMLIEILVQAISQMNSCAQRTQSGEDGIPRYLNSVILTVPPSMPIEEREILRSCIYEAIGILWKCLGYDKTGLRTEFKFVSEADSFAPRVPQVNIKWDEAQSGQLVYVYNELVELWAGNSKRFIKALRRTDIDKRLDEKLYDEKSGSDYMSTRIASIDIGGGTSDLVIIDYMKKTDANDIEDDIVPCHILRDGFKQAGDDIVREILINTIIPQIEQGILKLGISQEQAQSYITDIFSSNLTDVKLAILRQQLTQQILIKIGYRIIEHFEEALPYKPHKLKGTVLDFLNGTQFSDVEGLEYIKNEPFEYDEVVAEYFNKKIGHGCDILNFELEVDLEAMHQDFVTGGGQGYGYNYTNILDKLCELVNLYDVDVLLLTGRSSKLHFVREFMAKNLNLPLRRIVCMHEYSCGSWYPFRHFGKRIGDPKTTASVGALLNFLRLSHHNLTKFRYRTNTGVTQSNMRYIGTYDNNQIISDESVLYSFNPTVTDKDLRWMRVSYEKDSNEIIKYMPEETLDFNARLAIHIGGRQFADKSFNCNPLYALELKKNINDLTAIRNLKNLKPIDDFSDQSIDTFVSSLDAKLKDPAHKALKDLQANYHNLKDSGNKRAELEAQYLQEAQLYAAEVVKQKEASLGTFKRMFAKNDLKEEYDRVLNEYIGKHQAEIDRVIESQASEGGYALLDEAYIVCQDFITKHIETVSKRESANLASYVARVNSNEIVKVKLKLNSDPENYPYQFIDKELHHALELGYTVISLDRVKLGTDDIEEYCSIKLQTVSDKETLYWIDSGKILQE